MNGRLWTSAVAAALLASACAGAGDVAAGRPASVSASPTPSPTPSPSPTSHGWTTYSDADRGVSLRYPSSWSETSGDDLFPNFEGSSGWLQIDDVKDDGQLSTHELCEHIAAHHLQPYGSDPSIENVELQGQDGCYIWPSDDQDASFRHQSDLIIRYPTANGGYDYLYLSADKDHLEKIAATLRFI
jgi:TolB protein